MTHIFFQSYPASPPRHEHFVALEEGQRQCTFARDEVRAQNGARAGAFKDPATKAVTSRVPIRPTGRCMEGGGGDVDNMTKGLGSCNAASI